jgi:hypothetical protein
VVTTLKLTIATPLAVVVVVATIPSPIASVASVASVVVPHLQVRHLFHEYVVCVCAWARGVVVTAYVFVVRYVSVRRLPSISGKASTPRTMRESFDANFSVCESGRVTGIALGSSMQMSSIFLVSAVGEVLASLTCMAGPKLIHFIKVQ